MKKSEIYNIASGFGIIANGVDKIICKVLNISNTQLFLRNEIGDEYIEEIKNKLNRLNNGEPIEYIINSADFYSLSFFVDNRVLIPRNDTEVLVDKALDEIVKYEKVSLIDVGTGSSCIAISIFKNTNKINNGYVIDISDKALEVSNKNLIKYSLEKKIIQIKSNLLQKLLGDSDYVLDNNIVITANLPYIKDRDFENMDENTIKYEPKLALYGGEKTGFELYESLIHQCITLKKQFQNKKIILFIEIGFDQYKYSKQYLENIGLQGDYFKDNGGIIRCIKINI